MQKAFDQFSSYPTKDSTATRLAKRRRINISISIISLSFSLFMPIVFDATVKKEDIILSIMEVMGKYWFLVNCIFLSIAHYFFVLYIADRKAGSVK